MTGFWLIFSSVVVCGIVQGAEIQKKCEQSWDEYAVSSNRDEVWSSRLLDSTAKLPSGLFDGNLRALGNFDECTGVRAQKVFDGKDIRIFGKYCLANGKIENVEKLKDVELKVGICIPHYCSANDMNTLLQQKKFPLAPILQSDPKINLTLNFTDKFCTSEYDSPNLRAGDYLAIIFYSVIILLFILSTLYDVLLFYQGGDPPHHALIAFSAVSNIQKLFTFSKNDKHLNCLHGIRAISMMWIILGHTYSTTSLGAITNSFAILNWYKKHSSMYMLGATVAVDTFFLLSGIVLTYSFLQDRTRGTWYKKIIFSYIHRYIRLTPALAAVLICHISILKYIGQGPFWPISEEYLIDNCNKHWWSVLLYIQNYVNGNEQCVGQVWYLSVDMQMFLISPMILYPLKKNPKRTIQCVILTIFISLGATFFIAWYYRLNGLLSGQNLLAIRVYYIVTHTRAPPYLIGIIIGYYIHKAKFTPAFSMSMTIVPVVWVVSLIVLYICVFCGQSLLTDEIIDHIHDRGANAAYMTFVRPSWALALSWVIYACVTGYGGPINQFLSLKFFHVLSRFTYTLFLVHYTMLSVMVLSQKEPISFSDRSLIFQFWSNYMMALIFAICLTLTFESPVIALEKIWKCDPSSEENDPNDILFNDNLNMPRAQLQTDYSQVKKNIPSSSV